MRAQFVRVPKPADSARSVVKNKPSLWVVSLNGDPICAVLDAESLPNVLSVIRNKFSLPEGSLVTTSVSIVDQ